MEWTPRESLFVRIAGDWTEDDSNSRQGHRVLPSLLTNEPVLDSVFDTQAGLNNPDAMQRNRGIAGTVEWYINDALTFKSITAFRKSNTAFSNDFDGLQTVDVDVRVVSKDDQFSQEFRLQFTTDRRAGEIGKEEWREEE